MFFLDARKKFVGFFLLCFTTKIYALGVSPTFASLAPEAPIANLTLMNDRDVPVTIQIDLVKWEQRAEKDIYTPTNDLVITPQIFVLPPRGSQLIRIGMEDPAFGPNEKTYRIFAQEVLAKTKEKITGIQMAIRVSIPLVVRSQIPIQQQITWHANENAKKLTLVAYNKGNNMVFINQLQVFSSNHQPITKQSSTFAYILPGSKRTWSIDAVTSKKPTQIKTTVNNQNVLANL